MDQDLVKLLEQTGFTQKEAEVYLALLELSQGNVTQIAKITGLKRSIIYVLLEGLIKRGYASEIPDQKINTYQAMDPSLILRQIQSTAKNFSEMLPLFKTLHNKGKGRPKITYHETKAGIWKIYEEMTMSENPFFVSSYASIEKLFPDSIEKWINYKRRKVFSGGYHLIPNNPSDLEIGKKFKKVGENVRTLDIETIDMDFAVFGKKLAITSLENEPFIVVMESQELAKSMLALFRIIWAGAKEIK